MPQSRTEMVHRIMMQWRTNCPSMEKSLLKKNLLVYYFSLFALLCFNQYRQRVCMKKLEKLQRLLSLAW